MRICKFFGIFFQNYPHFLKKYFANIYKSTYDLIELQGVDGRFQKIVIVEPFTSHLRAIYLPSPYDNRNISI